MTPEQYRILFDETPSVDDEEPLQNEAAAQRWANTVLTPQVPIPPPQAVIEPSSPPVAQFRITPSEPEPEPAWLWKPQPPSFWKRLRLR